MCEIFLSDKELERLRLKKLAELHRAMGNKEKLEAKKPSEEENSRDILNKFFGDRAWEVFDAARAQYPSQIVQIEKTLVKLIKEGKVREMITGEELFVLFRRLGMRVKMETHIRVLEDGKVKSIEEKIREETSQ